jgi:hypothetical protein
MTQNLDPLDLNGRLYRRLGKILDRLEAGDKITLREELAALGLILKLQLGFMKLREETQEDPNAGTAIRKYAAAFQAHAVSSGAGGARTAADYKREAIEYALDDEDDEPDFDKSE